MRVYTIARYDDKQFHVKKIARHAFDAIKAAASDYAACNPAWTKDSLMRVMYVCNIEPCR